MLKKPNDVEITFEESHFDDFLIKLKEYPNIEYLRNVVEHDWGQRVIRFYDLDGHIVEVGEEMKMVINRFFKAGMSYRRSFKKSRSIYGGYKQSDHVFKS